MQNNITQSLVWKFLERFSVQFVQFFVSIIIARLLMPEEYGIMAILSIFITLSATIVQSGLGAALIQKKEVSVEDFSTVLYYSLSLAFLLYILLFFLSPHLQFLHWAHFFMGKWQAAVRRRLKKWKLPLAIILFPSY